MSVVIFAQDERSYLFGALVPYHEPAVTDAWMFRVRAVTRPWQATCRWTDIPSTSINSSQSAIRWRTRPGIIYDLTAITAVELLGSPQWGSVRFSATLYNDLYYLGTSDGQRRSAFLNNIYWMNAAEESDPTSTMTGCGEPPPHLLWSRTATPVRGMGCHWTDL